MKTDKWQSWALAVVTSLLLGGIGVTLADGEHKVTESELAKVEHEVSTNRLLLYEVRERLVRIEALLEKR